jgi:hypothetical protein
MTIESTSVARTTIQQLLKGHMPPLVEREHYGEWAEVVEVLHAAAQRGGASEVRRVFDSLAAAHRPLIALVAGSAAVADGWQRHAPPLPPEATAIYTHLAPCGGWLDAYIDFNLAAFPMTPRSFHEATGLLLVSLVVARRACLHVATTRLFPNLYLLYIAASGTYRKSTALGGVADVLRAADLLHLLLPERMTPQVLIERMSVGRIKQHRTKERQERWLKEQAFAGQRGWIRDEISALFTSMKREYNSELLELVLELYDCKEWAGESATITRGDDVIERSYLSLFGAANPDTMAPHLANRGHWQNGLWARFGLLVPGPDEPPLWEFYHEPMQIPHTLLDGLRRMYTLFPAPQATLCEGDDTASDSKKEPYVAVTNVQPPQHFTIDPRAREAWEAYSKATGWTLTQPTSAADLPPELVASYNRLGTQAIKVAMLLAVMDAQHEGVLHITLAHFARAQQIVERWRACLHIIWAEQSGSDDSRLMTRVVQALKRQGATGLTCRDLCNKLGVKAREVTEALEVLTRAGRVAKVEAIGGNGRQVELWTTLGQG